MEIRELRIGNYVYYKHPTTDVLIHKIEWLDFKEINEFPDIYNEYHKPIPLTEEILIKCGFVKVLGNYEMENFRFYLTKPANYNGMLFCEANNVITDKIQYLHQLQNMYQLLTNEELTIQL